MSNLAVATDDTFDTEVKNRPGLTLVDFWAPWCGPCRMLAPTLEKVQNEMGDKVKIVKVDIQENEKVAQQFNIQNIPFMMLFKDGNPVDQLMGNQPKPKIEKMVTAHL
ncbi:thioredoxin [Acanthopleuribacter pedis]|nr:thioredoxin [Acanthopleuribacter pedis]